MNLRTLTLAALACCAAAAAQADDAALLRCRAIADAGPRLACYDALPVGAAAAPRAAAGATAPAAAAAPAAATPQSSFGLATPPGAEVAFIESQVNGRFEGWNPDQQIELANGQVWRISDGSRAYFVADNPKVRIERGAFGAFYMVVAGINQAPRVRRVK
jgi:hypothetical protein